MIIRTFVGTLLGAVFLLTGGAAAQFADPKALVDLYHTEERQLFDIASSDYHDLDDGLGYVPIYRVSSDTIMRGDVLRLSGQIEVSEKNREVGMVAVYLRVHHPNGAVQRLSPVAYQWISRQSNHHMPVNAFGTLEARYDGEHVFELMAKSVRPLTIDLDSDDQYYELQRSGKAEKNMWVEYIATTGSASQEVHRSDFGQLIVEHYRSLADLVVADGHRPRGLRDWDRKRMPDRDVAVDTRAPEVIGSTKPFQVQPFDIIRAHGNAKGQYLSSDEDDRNLFSLTLWANRGSSKRRLGIATENILKETQRFSLHNEGYYMAGSRDTQITMEQAVNGLYNEDRPNRIYDVLEDSGEIATIHFSQHGNRAFFERAITHWAQNDLSIRADNQWQEIHSETGLTMGLSHIRVQSQAQISLDQATGLKCESRIEIWEDGVRRWFSVNEERFLRSDRDDNRYNFSTGSFTPFAIHQLSGLEWEVRQLARCRHIKTSNPPSNRDAALDARGTGLFIDLYGRSFGPVSPPASGGG